MKFRHRLGLLLLIAGSSLVYGNIGGSPIFQVLMELAGLLMLIVGVPMFLID